MGLTSLQVCMDSDWLQEAESSGGSMLDSTSTSPSAADILAACSTRPQASAMAVAAAALMDGGRRLRPPHDHPQKCPRCESTHTKFCYYNNYNLTQPRYFCKGCRRYWTHGGAQRNVPVGGGSRRNSKKGKNGNSKSSSSSSKQSSSTVNAPSSNSGQLKTNHQFPFLPTLHNLTQLGGIGLNLAATNGNYCQAHQIGPSLMNDLGFLHVGNGRTGNIHDNNNNSGENNLMAAAGSMNQFTLFDPATGLHAFQNESNIGNNFGISFSSTSMVDSRAYQTTPVKMEEQPSLVNLSRPVSSLTPPGNQTNQYFWTNSDLSGPSSKDHHQLL